MGLLEELKEKRRAVDVYINQRESQIDEHVKAIEALEAQRADLSRAISALTPAPRVLPSEPASSPHAEGYAPVRDGPEVGTINYPDGRVYEGEVKRDEAGNLVADGYGSMTYPEGWNDLIEDPIPDPLSISASSPHAAESDAVKTEHPDAPFWARVLTRKPEDVC